MRKKLFLLLLIPVLLLSSCGLVFKSNDLPVELSASAVVQAGSDLSRTSAQPSNTAATQTAQEQPDSTQRIQSDIYSLEMLYEYIDENFYFDIDYDKVYEALVTALFDSLDDKYSYYVKAEESEDYYDDMVGTYAGIGLYFSKTYLKYQDEEDETTLYCVVDRTFPNTPCSRAGLRSGDLIIAIDGEDTKNLEATECAARMKGPVGTNVVLTVKSKNGSIYDITLTRQIVTVPTVEHCVLSGDIGYIQITEFSTATWTKFCEAVLDFRAKGIKKLVLDLRSNSGGDINQALSIGDAFISDGVLLNIDYKSAQDETYIARKTTVVDPDVKVAVLTNRDSASSAEILTGILKDNGRAVIIGETTYGKGIMQQINAFGEGYVSLTVAGFTTASGEKIHGVGIIPDIEVEALTVKDEEMDAYLAVYEQDLISKYVDEHPEFTDENIQNFKIDPALGEIRDEVLWTLVRYEYINRLPGDEYFQPSPTYDECLKTAIDYLNGGIK